MPLPAPFERQDRIWNELNRWRGEGMVGTASFSWSDFGHYVTIYRERLTPMDLDILHVIEGQYEESCRVARERMETKP